MLLFPVGARAVALGQTLVAEQNGDAVYANPAGLAWLNRNQFIVHHANTADGKMDALSLLVTPKRVGTIGLSYQLFDWGDQEATDVSGNPVGRLSTREQMLIASFATTVVPGMTAGVNYKIYQFRSDCSGQCGEFAFTGTAQELDLGLQYAGRKLKHLRLGASLNNVGFSLQVVNHDQQDPPPSRLRVGGSYEVLHHFRPDSTLALWVSAEADQRIRSPGSPTPSFGVELSVSGAIFVMAGYRGGEGLNTGMAVGVGLRYQRFDIAVAKAFATSALDPQGEPLQVSFTLRF